MILEPPTSVQKLQTALQTKAKDAPNYRFYLLYDKLYRKDVLTYAYERCKANKGAPGIDGQEFAEIEAYGEERWLGELAETLRTKSYRPEAVRRVWIPKAANKLRPLGIPRIADRVVMTAAMVVLEPIFEVDMPAEQHGYRPNLSAHTAVREVDRLIHRGHTRIIEADLADYFGSIPHAELLKSVARRVSDRHILHLIRCGCMHQSKRLTAEGERSGRRLPRTPAAASLRALRSRRCSPICTCDGLCWHGKDEA